MKNRASNENESITTRTCPVCLKHHANLAKVIHCYQYAYTKVDVLNNPSLQFNAIQLASPREKQKYIGYRILYHLMKKYYDDFIYEEKRVEAVRNLRKNGKAWPRKVK